MTFKCSVPGCRSNYQGNLKFSVFRFPRNETHHQMWIKAIPNENFKSYKHSRVCELHFETNQIIREASAYDPRTGRTLTAPLVVPRLRKGAVPTLFMPSEPHARSRLNPNKVANKKKKNKLNEKTVGEETKTTDRSELAKLLQTDSGTESQTVVDAPSIVIKQEPVESANEPSSLVIKNVLTSEGLTSSLSSLSASNSSSASITVPLFSEKPPAANPNSASVNETQATDTSNKLPKKRKICDVKQDTEDSTPKGIQTKVRRRTKPLTSSKRNRPQPSVGVSNRSTGSSIPPAEDGTREMFQSLANDPEDDPSFGSITGERPGDLFDVFADFIAEKLREMNWDNCAYALRAILDIVFKAGRLQQDSEGDSDISDPNSPSVSSHEE